MRYALTYQVTEGEFDSVDTAIIEDGLLEGEVVEKSWRDGGEELIEILEQLGITTDNAKAIEQNHRYYIVNCDDITIEYEE